MTSTYFYLFGEALMITYKCKNCGGEMSVDHVGDLYCPYCGSKSNFSDTELAGYREFRTHMLSYLEAVAKSRADESLTEKIWSYAEKKEYRSRDGFPVTVNYLYEENYDGITIYMTRDSVLFVFDASQTKTADRMLGNISAITYPAADVKNLSRFIPSVKAKIVLEDGRLILAFSKDENMYPVSVFGALEYEHSAWILSRLENLACLMEYNDAVYGGFNEKSVYINPVTHEAAVYGGWWNASFGRYDNSDLMDIRKTVKHILGHHVSDAKKPFLDFLDSKPAEDAYEDFKAWDDVIETKLGGRHFKKFDI